MNNLHRHQIVSLGIMHGVTDCEFLMVVVDLLNVHGIAKTMSIAGGIFNKAMQHFIDSIAVNMQGDNAADRQHRDMHICASVTLLTVIALKVQGSDYATELIQK